MGYSVSDSMVRVDRFKERGKWYDSIAVDMGPLYYHPDLHDAVVLALATVGHTVLEGWIYVCLEPYHKNSHPVMIKGRV